MLWLHISALLSISISDRAVPPLLLPLALSVMTKPLLKEWHKLKLRCDTRFQRAFTACSCVFKVITMVLANQRNFFENAAACSKRTLKTTLATQL